MLGKKEGWMGDCELAKCLFLILISLFNLNLVLFHRWKFGSKTVARNWSAPSLTMGTRGRGNGARWRHTIKTDPSLRRVSSRVTMTWTMTRRAWTRTSTSCRAPSSESGAHWRHSGHPQRPLVRVARTDVIVDTPAPSSESGAHWRHSGHPTVVLVTRIMWRDALMTFTAKCSNRFCLSYF